MMLHRFEIVALALVALLLLPAGAYADDGFVGGLQDFTGVREVQVEATEDFFVSPDEDRLPVVRATLPENPGMIDYISGFIDAANSVPGGSNSFPLLEEASWLLRRVVVPVAILFVFFWWGLRKAVRMIFAGFRGGKASV